MPRCHDRSFQHNRCVCSRTCDAADMIFGDSAQFWHGFITQPSVVLWGKCHVPPNVTVKTQPYITPGQAEAETENQTRRDWGPLPPQVTVNGFTVAVCDENPIWQIKLKFPSCSVVADWEHGPGSSLSVRAPVDYTHHCQRSHLQEGKAELSPGLSRVFFPQTARTWAQRTRSGGKLLQFKDLAHSRVSW